VDRSRLICKLEGHLHTGGVRMVLSLNGQEICTSNATYGNNGIISGTTPCGGEIKVKKGDFMSMKSVYDIVKHPM
jgi:hypothetical protein